MFFKPDIIIGIARGGLTLSHTLAEGMGIREVQTLRTELYDKTCKRDMLSIFGECNIKEPSKVLVVDDVATSGGSIIKSAEILRLAGYTVNRAIVVVDRQEGGKEALSEKGIELESLFIKQDLLL